MSDTKAVAEEAPSSHVEAVAQTSASAQDSVENKSNEKTAVADTAADPAKAIEVEESSVNSNGNITEKKENGHTDKRRGGDRKDDRYSKYDRNDRGDKRKGFHNDKYRTKSKKPRTNEFEALPETDDPLKIRTQVEFYFSVQNLSTDKHLFIEIEGAKNRPVPIKHITSFKRMRHFQPYSAIVAALRDSQDLIVIDDGDYSGPGNEAVQRRVPLPVPKRDDDDEYKPTIEQLYYRMFRASQNKLDASVYVKGFGPEDEAGQIVLEDFFKPYGSIMVRKRRDQEENWKGSVFVEFDSAESQKQFLDLDPKPKFNGNELTIMAKMAYSEMKCEQKGITPAWKLQPGFGEGTRGNRENRGGRGGRGRGRGRGSDRGGRGGGGNDRRRDRSGSRDSRDSRDWNGRRDRFQRSRDYNGRDKRDKRDKRDRRDRSHDRSRSGKTEDKGEVKPIIKDGDGVPVIQDTSNEPSKSAKRKAEGDNDSATIKKSKIEFKVDA